MCGDLDVVGNTQRGKRDEYHTVEVEAGWYVPAVQVPMTPRGTFDG